MVLSDTSFWLAFFNPKDLFHKQAVEHMKRQKEGLITTWPVITETCYLLVKIFGVSSQLQFLAALEADYVEVYEIHLKHLPRINSLIQKYADLPMDLADASRVILAEQLGQGRILSTDMRDFNAYCWKNLQPFQKLLLPEN